MEDTNPATMVQTAKICRGFNQKWESIQYDVMFTGCTAKFEQNEGHRKYLLDTGDKTLIEGSRFDRTWGVGLDFTDKRIFDTTNWLGRNLLGNVLEKVRGHIKLHEY